MPVFPLKTTDLLRAAAGCALVSLLFAAAPARAQEEAPEVKILDSIMGVIGLSRGNEVGIDYRERSPLVLPPAANTTISTAPAATGTLPPPQSAKVANPNWPIDPEIKEARALAKASREGDGRTSSQRMDDQRLPLSRAELDKGRTNRRQNNSTRGDEGLLPSSWSELGYKGGIFSNMFSSRPDENPTGFTGEGPRTSLIDPPSGYQTPSPAQPYAFGKEKYSDKAIDNYGERKYDLNK